MHIFPGTLRRNKVTSTECAYSLSVSSVLKSGTLYNQITKQFTYEPGPESNSQLIDSKTVVLTQCGTASSLLINDEKNVTVNEQNLETN